MTSQFDPRPRSLPAGQLWTPSGPGGQPFLAGWNHDFLAAKRWRFSKNLATPQRKILFVDIYSCWFPISPVKIDNQVGYTPHFMEPKVMFPTWRCSLSSFICARVSWGGHLHRVVFRWFLPQNPRLSCRQSSTFVGIRPGLDGLNCRCQVATWLCHWGRHGALESKFVKAESVLSIIGIIGSNRRGFRRLQDLTCRS